jgi:hypothetical protein
MEDKAPECCRRSFAASLKDSAKEVLKNPKLVPRAERKERLAVCHSCDHYIEDSDQCDVCLCIMSIKASFEAMDCPLGKWKSKESASS